MEFTKDEIFKRLKRPNGKKEMMDELIQNSRDITAKIHAEEETIDKYRNLINSCQAINTEKIDRLRTRINKIIKEDSNADIDSQEIDELEDRIDKYVQQNLEFSEKLAKMEKLSAEKQKEYAAALKAQTEAIKELKELPQWTNFLIGGIAKGVISALCIALAWGAKCIILDKGGLDKQDEFLFNGFSKAV